MRKKTVLVLILLSLVITMVMGCGVSGGGSNQTTGSSGQGGNTSIVSLAWDPQTTYLDGTTIAGPVGYKVYYGNVSGTYTHIVDVQNATSCSLDSLPHGTWYFAITCYDSNGIEGALSQEISTTI